MSKSPEKLGEIIQSRLFQMRKRSDRFFKELEIDLKRLNKMTTRVTNKLYDQVLSSLETIPGTSMPINTVGNLSQVSTLMQGLDAIQNDYRQAYGQLIRNARLDMLEIVITREAALEKVLKDEEGIIEDRTLVSDQSFEMMDVGYQKTLQRMNVILDKWKSFAYDTFYSGLIKGVPISLFKSWFFNENGTLKIGSSLDEESTYTAVQSIVEQRTAYLRGKAQENDWKFCWNSNPMDPLTKSECIDATIAGVISEAEMGSGYGFPPRHICRCEIVYTRPEWVRVNQGVNTSIEKSRQSLVQQLINAPRQKGKWTRNGKVVKAKDITRAKGNLMYKEVEDKLGLLADRGPVSDFDYDDFGGSGIPPALPSTPIAIKKIKKLKWNRDLDYEKSISQFKDKVGGFDLELSKKMLDIQKKRIVNLLGSDFVEIQKGRKGLRNLLEANKTKSGKIFISDLKKFNKKGTVGRYFIDNSSIEIASKQKVIPQLTIGKNAYTVGRDIRTLARHEMGHHIQSIIPQGFKNKEWAEIYKKLKVKKLDETISKHASINSQELFAESFSAYTSPLYKKGMMPQKIEQYFDKIFK